MAEMKLDDFRRTRAQIQPYIRRTPVIETEWPDLNLKLENLQCTHSFKIRGAFSRMLKLQRTGDQREVLTVSAGNHGHSVAYAASVLSQSCTVIIPHAAPKAKVDAIRAYGIDLAIKGSNYDEAEAHALSLAKDENRWVFVSPYNDRDVILGQGTLALELIEQQPDLTQVIIPIGGGGLAAGVGAAMKKLLPSVRIIGVQAEASAAIYQSLKEGKLVTIPDKPTLADGIQGNVEAGSMTFELIRNYVDDVVTVREDEIREAIRVLLSQEKVLAEGAAAVTVAAFCSGRVSGPGPMVAIISGGNLDLEKVL